MRQRVSLVIAVSLLFGALALQPASSAVVIKGVAGPSGSTWSPRRVSVAPGTRVVWKAINTTHTVTHIGNKWSKNVTLSVGETTSFRFTKVGTYRFRCTIHSTYNPATKKCSGMCGKVVVG